MTHVRYPIVELRQYTLHPGQRDVLIDLFDREFVETQEATGMAVIAQFRDLDAPDRFVWLRGFEDMPSRAEALTSFYGGPVWKAHRTAANATMIDSDDVLLLRPSTNDTGFPLPAGVRPADQTTTPSSAVLATLYHRDHPFDQTFMDFFHGEVQPVLGKTGATPLACLQSEHAENTFPALPVRTGENVFVWFARFDSLSDMDSHREQLDRSTHWQEQVQPALTTMISGTQQLRLTPTARSLLR
jgi:quinol monooxygenase YgiN